MSRAICAALLGGAMLAVAVPAASAAEFWDKATFDFGSRNVGTTSDPTTFALIVTCDADAGFPTFSCTSPPNGVHNTGVPTVTSQFAIVPSTDGCTPTGGVMITPTYQNSAASCTLQVTFKPNAPGVRTGSLSTPNGPDVALKGVGVATPGTTTSTKKCKKKGKKSLASAAKKKCKKK